MNVSEMLQSSHQPAGCRNASESQHVLPVPDDGLQIVNRSQPELHASVHHQIRRHELYRGHERFYDEPYHNRRALPYQYPG